MSTSTKLRLLDEANEANTRDLIKYLRGSPLLKITGDNLDVFIKVESSSIHHQNRDLHLFASNAISVRAANPTMDTTIPTPRDVTVGDFLLSDHEGNRLKYSYSVMISRILSEMPAFYWMKDVTPKHLSHPLHREMAKKSMVVQLPIIMKNEAKYEEVLDIMDANEVFLQQQFRKAHGGLDNLNKFKVVVGGDQLTKVRFVGAKNLRRLAPTASGRLEHQNPIVIELWHLKQDFLEKAYRELFKNSSKRQEGTLSYFKNILNRTDINGVVKGRYQSHSDFLKLMTKCFIKEMVMEMYDMQTDGHCPALCDMDAVSHERKVEKMGEISERVLSCFRLLHPFDTTDQECHDDLYSYCINVCHWGLHLIHMDDTVKEGDTERTLPNLKVCMPFFYSHSSLSKYFIECIDYILKCDFHLSPLDRLRVLEGSYVNLRGGSGNNLEADLVQEHHIRFQKDLIKGLGANKTDVAIKRATGAACIVNKIVQSFDRNLQIAQKGSRHKKFLSQEDEHTIKVKLRHIRPFKMSNGRKCIGFTNIKRAPSLTINKGKMEEDLKIAILRLRRGCYHAEDDETECDVEETEDDVNLFQDLPELE